MENKVFYLFLVTHIPPILLLMHIVGKMVEVQADLQRLKHNWNDEANVALRLMHLSSLRHGPKGPQGPLGPNGPQGPISYQKGMQGPKHEKAVSVEKNAEENRHTSKTTAPSESNNENRE